MWAWIAAFWISVVSWDTVWQIAASWVISPVLWWIIAATFLYGIKKSILFKEDMVENARKWVPFFLAIMTWAFTTYLIIKWIKNIIKIDFPTASIIWLWIAFIVYLLSRYKLSKNKKIKNNRESVNLLFTVPLIAAVWLLSFAHWANDVANAIWPIAAIYDTVVNWTVNWSVGIPFWILVLWGIWISLWLAFYWPRIISTVWSEITELDRIRAFAIALAASITVIIASQLWLPVSSTHIALGWIFW
jgi:PiT family inorganic phosphate transporter